jgi:hypothetical protein
MRFRIPISQLVTLASQQIAVSFIALFYLSQIVHGQSPAKLKTENLILITIDGLRSQEIFNGAQRALITPDNGGVRSVPTTHKQWWRETSEERRQVLMPFLWNTIAKNGQLFGDQSQSCISIVTNETRWSYPGYSEMLCGFADNSINSNAPILNPNINVLEWLNQRPGFAGRVAAYNTWDTMSAILNVKRNNLPVIAGWWEITNEPLTPVEKECNTLVRDLPRLWNDNVFDIVTMRASLEYLKKHKPRVLYIGLGETDEWAHMRRYDVYLEAANKADQFVAQLWELVQSMPEYAGKTSLVITTDHGRGTSPKNWTDHNNTTEGAEYTWIGIIGPDTPALGIRQNLTVTQSQIAATLAGLLGEDFAGTDPRVAQPLANIIKLPAQ